MTAIILETGPPCPGCGRRNMARLGTSLYRCQHEDKTYHIPIHWLMDGPSGAISGMDAPTETEQPATTLHVIPPRLGLVTKEEVS